MRNNIESPEKIPEYWVEKYKDEAVLRTHYKLINLVVQRVKLTIGSGDAAIVVDAQNDFGHPKGALYVPGAEKIIEPAFGFTLRFESANRFFTADCHPENHCSFQENGGQWPRHCVQSTWGAEFFSLFGFVSDKIVIYKGQDKDAESYGAVHDTAGKHTQLIPRLQTKGINRVFVYMLAFDFCVGETAEQLAEAGFETYVVVDLTKTIGLPVGGGRDTIDVMVERLQKAGVKFITSDQVF